MIEVQSFVNFFNVLTIRLRKYVFKLFCYCTAVFMVFSIYYKLIELLEICFNNILVPLCRDSINKTLRRLKLCVINWQHIYKCYLPT